MYYLFEFILNGTRLTYKPGKIISKLDIDNITNRYLVAELDAKGIINRTSYHNKKFVYLKLNHENVIHGGNYDKIIELVRDYKIDNLINEST